MTCTESGNAHYGMVYTTYKCNNSKNVFLLLCDLCACIPNILLKFVHVVAAENKHPAMKLRDNPAYDSRYTCSTDHMHLWRSLPAHQREDNLSTLMNHCLIFKFITIL